MQRQMAWLCSLPTSATRRRLPLLFLSWSKALVPQSRAQSPKQRASRRCAAAACASQLAHAPARHSVARHAFKTTSFAGAELSVAELHHKSGYLHIIMGPMFAGKTTTLLSELQAEEESGNTILVAKSDRDGRYAADEVVSHDGLRRPCRAVKTLMSLVASSDYQLAQVVAIDEAQFFPDLVEFCRIAVDQDHKRVHVAGLDGDFMRQPFGKVVDLVPLADRVTKKAGLCRHCGHASLFSLRTVSDTRPVLVGGAEIYEPVCRRCYLQRHVVFEGAAGAPLAR